MSARIAPAAPVRDRLPAGRRRGARSRLAAICEAATLTIVPMVVWPPTAPMPLVLSVAEASPASCTKTGLGDLCSQTDKRGVHVAGVQAWLSGVDGPGKPGEESPICNKELRVRGTLADGGAYQRSAVSQCGWDRVSMRFDVDRDFRDGSYVCAAVREFGPQNPWEPYEACTRIRR